MKSYITGVPDPNHVEVHKSGKSQDQKKSVYTDTDTQERYILLQALKRKSLWREFLLEHTKDLLDHPEAEQLSRHHIAVERRKTLQRELLAIEIERYDLLHQIGELQEELNNG